MPLAEVLPQQPPSQSLLRRGVTEPVSGQPVLCRGASNGSSELVEPAPLQPLLTCGSGGSTATVERPPSQSKTVGVILPHPMQPANSIAPPQSPMQYRPA